MKNIDYWNRYNTRQRAIEKRFIGGKDVNGNYKDGLYPAMRRQYQSVLTSIRVNGYEYTRNNIYAIVRPDEVVKVLKKMYRYAAWIEGNYVGSSLIKSGGRKGVAIGDTIIGSRGKDAKHPTLTFKRLPGSMPADASFSIGFDELAPVVDEYFRIYQLNVAGLPIADKTIEQIEARLFSRVQGGQSLDQAIREYREWALTGTDTQSAMSKTRALRILQTEGTRAMSFGGLIGAYKSGVDVDKVWVTSDDERVRGANPLYFARYPHTRLDGQVSSLFGAFNNGEPIKFPGDPDASIGNTINCRCSQYFREKARPKPRVTGRTLQRFLTDFFTGFFFGTEIVESLLMTNTE